MGYYFWQSCQILCRPNLYY